MISVHDIFLGFLALTKGYIFLNLKYHRIEISRHIIFYENHFPYMSKNDKNDSPNSLSLPIPLNYYIIYDLSFEYANTTPEDTTPREDISPHEDITPHEDNSPIQTIPDAPPKRSSRPRRPPTYLEDLHTQIPNASNASSKYPIHKFLYYSALSSTFKNIVLSISSHTEPRNYNEASKHDCWQQRA